jgi:hypothetical protein
MNAPHVCKLRKNCLTVIDQCAMVLKTLQFLHFSVNGMGDGWIFRASLFNEDLSNEPNFGRIHLAGQYL